MKISFGREIYHDAMCGIDTGKDAITFKVNKPEELGEILTLILKHGCDVLIENDIAEKEGV